MRRAMIGLMAGGAAVLGFGIWLGGQRAAADRGASAPSVSGTVQAQRVAIDGTGHRPVLPKKPIAPGLAEDLRDRDPLVRRNAIADLAASGTAEPRVLVEASRDLDLNVAVAATEGLGALYRDGQLPASELVARIASAPPKVRVAAINGLGIVASPESAQALSELVVRGSEIDRRSAAIVLVHQDAAIAVPALIGALADGDAIVRANAREALRTFARGRDFGEDAGAWQRWWQTRTR